MIPHLAYHMLRVIVSDHISRESIARAEAWPFQETQYHEERIYTASSPAIVLPSTHLFSEPLQPLRPPTHSHIYIDSYVVTPGLYRIGRGVF